jgi:signal transduction histidine kinase
VRELGGRLEIRSIKTGTTISVALPALKIPAAPNAAAASLLR